jgi:hypothetical protein
VDAGLTGTGRNLTYQVAEWATLCAGADEVAQLRRQPGSPPDVKLAASFLKHADDQTVLGLATVLKAMARRHQPASIYRDWGIVSGPKMFGRDSMAWAVDRYLAEGAWGIPPHIIPHGTLHASSGTISQALASHGPNLTASGGPGACTEAILIAATMLADKNLPGLWLVLSAYIGEKLPEDPACAGMQCNVAALALTTASRERQRPEEPGVRGMASPTLRIDLGHDVASELGDFTLPAFRAAIDSEGSGRWRLPEGGLLELIMGAR